MTNTTQQLLVHVDTGFIFGLCHADATYDDTTNTLTDYRADENGDLQPLERAEINVSLETVDDLPEDFAPGMYCYHNGQFVLTDEAFYAKYNMTRQQGVLVQQMLAYLDSEQS